MLQLIFLLFSAEHALANDKPSREGSLACVANLSQMKTQEQSVIDQYLPLLSKVSGDQYSQMISERNKQVLEIRQSYFKSLGVKAKLTPGVALDLVRYESVEFLKQIAPLTEKEQADLFSNIEILEELRDRASCNFLFDYHSPHPDGSTNHINIPTLMNIFREEAQTGEPFLKFVLRIKEERASEIARTPQMRADAFFEAEKFSSIDIEPNGKIKVDETLGAPNPREYGSAYHANQLLAHDPALRYFSVKQQSTIRLLASAFQKNRLLLYEGRNADLLNFTMTEPTSGYTNVPIDEYFNDRADTYIKTSNRMKIGSKWWSQKLTILAKNSHSPLRKMYGKNAKRKIMWPLNSNGQPNLDLMRVAINEDRQGNEKSMEVLYYKKGSWFKSGSWEPYFYLKAGDTWMAAKKFQGENVETACIKCHTNNSGDFSPLPRMLQTWEELRNVGYNNPHVIEQILKWK